MRDKQNLTMSYVYHRMRTIDMHAIYRTLWHVNVHNVLLVHCLSEALLFNNKKYILYTCGYTFFLQVYKK